MRFLCQGLALILLAVSLGDSWAHAQRQPNQMRAMRPRSLRGQGQLLAIKPGLMQVRANSGEIWLMKIEARPEKILVQGAAVAGWLRSNMLVRFSAILDGKGVAQAPVDELIVFTPQPGFRIGVFPEPDQLFAGDKQPPTKRTRRRRGAMPEGRYLVAGRLVSFRDGEFRVTAGSSTVRAQLAEKAKIRVDAVGDFSLVRQGDKVDYIGKFYEKGKAIVSELTFTAASPFGSEAEATAKKRSGRTKDKRSGGRETPAAKEKKPT